jgi:hypothetical protein
MVENATTAIPIPSPALADLKRCTRCILPDTFPGITFDGRGVCDHCRSHVAPAPRGEAKLLEAIEKYRDPSSQYDCIVGLSGGRDSTFTLHFAVKKLGLRVLACTIDNGFMPQETCASVRHATKILGVDHVMRTHMNLRRTIKPVLAAWIRHPSVAMISSICTGCRISSSRGLENAAKEYHTPLLLSGSGEPGSDEYLGVSFFSKKTHRNVSGTMQLLSGFAGEVLKNPRYLSNPRVPLMMFREYCTSFIPRCVRRMLPAPIHGEGLFRYVPWNEQVIMDVIQNELKWKKPAHQSASFRSDCTIATLKSQLYLRTLGFSVNDVMISGMIRDGQMTREEGLARIERDNAVVPGFLDKIAAGIGLEIDWQELGLTA